MTFWITLWKVVLIGSLAIFAVMAVVVTIGGYFDIKRLFATLAKDHEEGPQKAAGNVHETDPNGV